MTTTLLEPLRRQAEQRPEEPAYGERTQDGWRLVSWRDYHRQIQRCGRAFLRLGLEHQERVCILSNNRPEWSVACLGATAAGGVPVGVYQTCSPEQVAYIVSHAETRILVLENLAQWQKIEAARDALAGLEKVVMMPGVDADKVPEDPLAIGWDAFLTLGDSVAAEELEARQAQLTEEDLASMIYTSGTTGRPKAVMLSHRNMVETCRMGQQLHRLSPADTLVSYLPLAHIAEQMISIQMPAFIGYRVYFLDSPLELLKVLEEVQPTVFFGVPRVWERFYSGVSEKLRGASAPARALLSWAGKIGRKRAEASNVGGRLGVIDSLCWRLAEGLVLRKVRTKMGLRQVRIAVSGAAPVAREILDFFAGLGVSVYEVYGLSETTGPSTWNSAGRTKFGTVGPALPGVDVRIAEDGEVLVRGPNVFQGYFKAPEATAEVLEADGWFATGDLGSLDADGFLVLTGRKKEILITSGGKNIAPAGLETKLQQIDLVGDVMVVGDGRRFVAALLTLDADALEKLASLEEAPGDDPRVLASLREGIQRVNSQLARVETVRNFRVLPRRWSSDGGELTPTMKVRRQAVAERYRAEIEAMYEEGQVLSPDGG